MSVDWLTPDEQRAWRTYLRMSTLLPSYMGRQLQRDSGLSLPEYEVLVQLSEAPGHRMRPFQLCEALNWEQSRLSHQLTRMEKRGLVSREECAADGRGAEVILRTGGADSIKSAAPGHVAAVREVIFNRLSEDELAAFERACTAILDALTGLTLRVWVWLNRRGAGPSAYNRRRGRRAWGRFPSAVLRNADGNIPCARRLGLARILGLGLTGRTVRAI